MNSPCKDCPDRMIGCHSTCKKYIEFREKLNSANKARQQVLRDDSTHIEDIRKNRRKQR